MPSAYNTQTQAITGGDAQAYPNAWLAFGAPETIAATGTSQATGVAIVKPFSIITGANGTKAAYLPQIQAPGETHVIYNVGTGDLILFPGSAQIFNDGSADASITVEDGTLVICVAGPALTWGTIFTAG